MARCVEETQREGYLLINKEREKARLRRVPGPGKKRKKNVEGDLDSSDDESSSEDEAKGCLIEWAK